MNNTELIEALRTLGELLETRGISFDGVVIGGGGLLMLGLIERPTRDIDLVAKTDDGLVLLPSHPLSEELQRAVQDVGDALGLGPKWLNGGPTELLTVGLPEGLLARTTISRFGALTLRVASRFDQIHFKLYAAVDQGPDSKHSQDLRRLKPSQNELTEAAAWCLRHDVSEAFKDQLQQALAFFGEKANG